MSRTDYIMMEERARRLYCLECGKAALVTLPADQFVRIHSDLHKMDKDEVKDMFLVVERGKDKYIRLGEDLGKLLATKGYVWSGVPAWAEEVFGAEADDDE